MGNCASFLVGEEVAISEQGKLVAGPWDREAVRFVCDRHRMWVLYALLVIAWVYINRSFLYCQVSVTTICVHAGG